MNKIISDLPGTDQIPQSTEKLEDDFHDHSVKSPATKNEVPRTQVSMNKSVAPDVKETQLSSRTVERIESRHTLTITDRNYKAIVRNLSRYNPNNRAFYIFAMEQIGIKPGQPLPDDFPKKLMNYTELTPKVKQIILKRLEGELRQKWSTQTLKGELNAYQKQLDKEHGIDPSDIKAQKLQAYQEKLAKQEFDIKLLFLMVEYANKSEECALVIAKNITLISQVLSTSYKGLSAEDVDYLMGMIFPPSSSDEKLLAAVLAKATEIYQMTQKTAQYTPIMAQRDLVSAKKLDELLSSLMKGDRAVINYSHILSSLGIEKDRPLSDDLTSRLLNNKELTAEKKKIILESFKDELSAKMSLDAYIHKINVHDRTLATNPETKSTEGFQRQLAKNHFQENLAAKLMERNLSFGEISLDQYESLKDCKNTEATRDQLIVLGIDTPLANNIAGDVQVILQNSKKIDDYKAPELNDVKKNELKRVFSDPEILKILSFLQTDQTAADRKVIHYEGVKASPEVIDELISSPEFTEFMTGFESVIFADDIKEEFDRQVQILSNPDVSSKDKKSAEKALKALEEKMIKNVSTHFNKIGDKLQINETLSPEETNTAQKLTALLNVADGKKIATKDTATIIKHRILLGIKLATLSLFAAAAVSVIVIGLLHVFLPALAAMTVAIIVTAVMGAFGVIGFNIGTFGSDELREQYEKLITHLKEMGTNLNVRQSEAMATPLFTKFI